MSLWRLLLLKSHFHQTPASGRNGKISQTISEPSAGVWNWLPQNLALSDVALFEHIYIYIYAKKKHRLPSCSLWKRQFGGLIWLSSIFIHFQTHQCAFVEGYVSHLGWFSQVGVFAGLSSGQPTRTPSSRCPTWNLPPEYPTGRIW